MKLEAQGRGKSGDCSQLAHHTVFYCSALAVLPQRNLEAARIYNSRHVVWPVGGSAVRIPATAASLETLASTAGYAAVPLSDSAAGMPAEAKAKISVPLRLGPAEDRMLGAGAKVPLKKLPAPTGAAGSASSSSAGGAAKLPQQFINVED